MFNDFELTVTGGFAIVTIAMWVTFVLAGIFIAYQSRFARPLRKLVSSIRVLLIRKKTEAMYIKLHKNGYIYKWSRDLALRRLHQ